jgi:hypothetical protein
MHSAHAACLGPFEYWNLRFESYCLHGRNLCLHFMHLLLSCVATDIAME